MKTIRMILPGSKGLTTRALLIAASASGTSTLQNISTHHDVLALIDEIQKTSVSVSVNNTTCEVNGDVDFFSKSFSITHLNPEFFAGGEVELSPLLSKDYIWALFIASPFADAPLLIKAADVPNQIEINITCDMMGDFGVLVRRMHQARYLTPVPQEYRARDYLIEPDYTFAAYFFAAAFFQNREFEVQPVDQDSNQPAIKFLKLLEKWGAQIHFGENEFSLKGVDHFPGINIDMREYKNILFPLVATSIFASSPSILTNILDVADIQKLKQTLEKLKIKVEAGEDWLKIFPSEPRAANFEIENNSRLAMFLALIKLRVPKITISGTNDTETFSQFL